MPLQARIAFTLCLFLNNPFSRLIIPSPWDIIIFFNLTFFDPSILSVWDAVVNPHYKQLYCEVLLSLFL